MATAVRMPKLGMTMEEGKLVSWAVAVGDRVAKGQLLLVIESEKAESEIEATAAGVLRHVWVEPGETVPCGTLLAALTESADAPFDAEAFRREHATASGVGTAASPTRASAEPTAAAAPARAARPARRRPVAPAARKLARELGIDPDEVTGTGPGGRVVREDVQRHAEARASRVAVRGGVRLDVPRSGSGEPVLLLPGFGNDVSSFALQVRALAEHHAVAGVNPRGVGGSDAPEAEAYTVAEAAADVAALVDAPAHVVGASLGAAVALELALVHPEKVRSLALLTPFVEASPRLLAVVDAWTRLAAEARPDTLARALLPWLFSPHFLADDAARERVVRGLAASVARVPASTLARAAAGLRAWSGTRAGDLGGVRAPALVVAGSHDLLTPDAQAVAEPLAGARTLRVEAGHAVAIEAADAVSTALLEHFAAAPPSPPERPDP